MPRTPGFEAWAAGTGSQEPAASRDRLDIVFKIVTVPVLLWAGLVFALWLGHPPHRFFLEHVALIVVVVFLGTGYETEFVPRLRQWHVIASGDGLQVSGLFRRRTIPWAEVTDYFLCWPHSFNRVMREMRIPSPEELSAVIKTGKESIVLRPTSEGREAVCREVRNRAAVRKDWSCPDYEVTDGVRDFRYQSPNSPWLYAYFRRHPYYRSVFLMMSLVFAGNLLLTNHMDRTGQACVSAFWLALAVYFVAYSVFIMKRESRIHTDENITITPSELVWEKAGQRVEMKWPEVCGLKRLSEFPLNTAEGLRGPWEVRTSQSVILFYTNLMGDAGGLPALIYERSPKLHKDAVPVTSPVRPELQPG